MSTTPSAVSGAKEQVARLLTLVPYLHSRGTVRLAEAADALDVSPEQLLLDLKVLFMCGLPGGYPDDLIDIDLDALESEDGEPRSDGVIRVSNAEYLSRPLRLTPTEASAVIVALRALRAGARGDTVAVVDRALGKLESAAAAGPVEVALEPSTADDGAVTAELAGRLHGAVERQLQVELHYYVPARDELSHRCVDPRGLVQHGGFTYLDAWCHSAEAPRLFRLDRVADAKVLDTPVSSGPAAPRNLDDGLFAHDDDTTVVTLRLAPAARWVTEYYPIQNVRRDELGGVEVELLVADARWLTRLLLRLAPHAVVVAPAAYADDYTAAARDTLRLYS